MLCGKGKGAAAAIAVCRTSSDRNNGRSGKRIRQTEYVAVIAAGETAVTGDYDQFNRVILLCLPHVGRAPALRRIGEQPCNVLHRLLILSGMRHRVGGAPDFGGSDKPHGFDQMLCRFHAFDTAAQGFHVCAHRRHLRISSNRCCSSLTSSSSKKPAFKRVYRLW